MAWNKQPGDGDDPNKKKDPWRREEEGPPNLDEALRQLQNKIRALFGLGKGSVSFSTGHKIPSNRKTGLMLIGMIGLAAYLIGGIYVVEPAEEAVVCRFGRYVNTHGPGPHWIAPLIETKKILNVQEVKNIKSGGLMLTKDENIVSVDIAVQYRIGNARHFLFNLVKPIESLEQVSESAVRSVVGQSTLNEVLTSGRSEISAEIRKKIQQNLNNYQSGLEISDLAMQQTKAPEQVKAAFDDAIKAQQDEERLVNEAQAYARKIIPIAEGHAKRTFEEARAYKERSILEAQGKTAKFAEILPEYKLSPQITRERMFIDTLQEVYANTSKVIIDVNGGNNLVYLPLDKLIQQNSADGRSKEDEEASSPNEKSNQNISVTNRRINVRPTYEDAERLSREGA